MDLLDLVYRAEKEFDIRIDRSDFDKDFQLFLHECFPETTGRSEQKCQLEAFQHYPLGRFYDLIIRKVLERSPPESEGRKRFEQCFEQVRRFFSQKISNDGISLQVDTEVASLLPMRKQRRHIWKELRKQVSGNIPSLEFGPATSCCLFFGLPAVIPACILWFFWRYDHWAVGPIIIAAVFGGVILGLFAMVLLVWLTTPWGTLIPDSCKTLGGIAAKATGSLVQDDGSPWNAEAVERRLQSVFSEALAIPKEKLTRERLFKELE